MAIHSQYSSPHIAFIDSGIGGLSILSQVKLSVPNMRVSYFMDNHFLPYGELEGEFLITRLSAIVAFLQTTAPDLVVMACNTASTQALEQLRCEYDVPFVGVVPAIKPAALLSKNKHIGLLATKATVQGLYIQTLIGQYAADCQVTSLGSSEVVACAEAYFWHGYCDKPLPDLTCFTGVDTLVLGCTHFPLIKSQLIDKLPVGIALVDSGEAIARRVKQLLEDDLLTIQPADGSIGHMLYCTKPLNDLQIQRLKVEGFQGVECVMISQS